MSDYVKMPVNITEWTNQNDGQKYIQIEYVPSDYSEVLFQDLDINMDFSWSISSIESKQLPLRMLQSDS